MPTVTYHKIHQKRNREKALKELLTPSTDIKGTVISSPTSDAYKKRSEERLNQSTTDIYAESYYSSKDDFVL